MSRSLRSPEDLFAAAQMGAKLKPRERLQVVVWLEKTGQVNEHPESALAKTLGCKLGSLHKLRTEARKVVASAITPEEAANYMAEFLRHSDLLIATAIDGIKTADKHSGAYQGYMRLLKEVSAEKIEKLQSIGVIPKELGRLTQVSEEWVATVDSEGVASVRPDTEGTDESAG